MSTEEASPLSPCPHTPACPPPVCLPPSLRPRAATATPVHHDPAGGTNLPGYETRTGHIDGFAGTMSGTADGVGLVRERTPRFEGWNLAPLAGVPVIGLMFVNRLNTISDTWRDSAGILRDVLRTDAAKVGRAAANYRQAENPGGEN